MYISNLKIRNYRNFFKSSIDIKKDITTIIGENGVGKTNLFYAIKQLLDRYSRHSLDENDFSYELSDFKGHWIIISATFNDIPNTDDVPEAVALNPDVNNSATYSLIFRPNKIIRNTLYNLSCDFINSPNEEKDIKRKIIEEFINDIDVKNDYEVKKTVGSIFDFLNDDKYCEMVGDFWNCIFPSPDDIQEDTALIGDKGDSDLTKLINVTFIPAIRDVNLELVKEGNFFEKILSNVAEEIDELEWKSIKANFDLINDKLGKIDNFTQLANDIYLMMNNTVGSSFSGNMRLDVSIPEEKSNIIKYFSLKGIENNHSIDLYNKSLGENNVLYFALKMLQNTYTKGHTRKLFNILIIEEPESHLHKHLQQTFFTGIRKTTNTQILLSTHSVHISESCNISSMIVIGKKDNKSCEIYNPSNGLDELEVKYLERYLDSVRLPILFSKSIILVEGDAELIFISNILKLKYNLDLNSYGISLIPMDNCFFEKISKIFDESRLRKKCSILTDLDKDFEGKENRAEWLSKKRLDALFEMHKNNKYVKIYTNDYTFEIELYSNNLNMFLQYIKDRNVYKDEKIYEKFEASIDMKERYKRILLVAERLGKGWLALDFIEWLREKGKKFIDEFKIPEYIKDSLKNFFPSDIYDKSVYNQIVLLYCESVGVEEENITDDFILYIKELRDA